MRSKFWIVALMVILVGCSSGQPSKPVTHMTAASAGDYRAVYWLDSQQGQVIGLAEQVWQGDYGRYRSEYVWRDGSLRAIKREGTQLAGAALAPFSIYVRFDASGEPVFQRYQQDETLLPLSSATLTRLYQEANQVQQQAKTQLSRDVSVWQAQRQGDRWVDCRGDTQRWTFSDTIDPSVVSQISQPGTFLVAGGDSGILRDNIDFLVYVDNNKACLQRPRLLDE
ncbi:DUF1481 domain-containing protein [Salinivibrio sp. AR640]|uniref:DUF1481 domain-containing protein n=1 Tax=Salinivibrio sp. AR640 TaxID=1909437 RepID=UPI00098742D1|nr:DUF1481 domain-containing protein [Salinivibrio sp. AR640]OOE91073.1 hypothetical protein BZG75_11390 [Salinivibrio sp. AR640]